MTVRLDSGLAGLLEQVKTVAASPANQARGKKRPFATFSLETPIAQSKIFGYDVNWLFSDPRFYIEQMLREKLWRWETFPLDDQPLTADINALLGHYPEYPGLGLDLTYTHEGVPLFSSDHPLMHAADLALLRPYAVREFSTWGWNPRMLRWYDDLQCLSAGRLPVIFGMTWWRGCLDLAIALRGFDAFLEDTRERPHFVHDLLKWITEQRCRWWDGYYAYFGKTPGPCPVADDWVNVPFISPRIFAEFVLPRYRELEVYHGGISGFHSCGNTAPLQRYLLELTSLNTLEVSPWTDLAASVANIPANKALAISLHPNDVLLATPSEMRAKLDSIVELCKDRSYTIGTGGLTPITPDTRDYCRQINQWQSAVETVFTPVWLLRSKGVPTN